jgi:hypothetical protein
MPSRITMIGVVGNVLIHLGFERCYQHARALKYQRIQVELECLLLGLFRSDYPQHAAYLFMDGLIVVRLQQPEGYAALLTSASIHNFRLYLLRKPPPMRARLRLHWRQLGLGERVK